MSNRLLMGLGYLGLAISIYALYVEYRHEIDGGNFVALCDLSASVSCSRVLTNKDARIIRILFEIDQDSVFNLPNAAIGAMFYLIVISYGSGLLNAIENKEFFFFLTSVSSCIASLFLSYVLVFILEDLCILCISTYFINGFILVLSALQLRGAHSQVSFALPTLEDDDKDKRF